MPVLKTEFRDRYRSPKPTYCPRCRDYTIHLQRFDKESEWTYFACDICEFFLGEEVLVRQ